MPWITEQSEWLNMLGAATRQEDFSQQSAHSCCLESTNTRKVWIVWLNDQHGPLWFSHIHDTGQLKSIGEVIHNLFNPHWFQCSISQYELVAQWFRYLPAEPEAGSLIPHCTSLTGAGLDDLLGPFQLCSSKIKGLLDSSVAQWWSVMHS